jgi:hypothetical protein
MMLKTAYNIFSNIISNGYPKIVDKPKILFFVGSPRTGSTLLGQLLNYHPACLVANESRFITGVIGHNETMDAAFDRMLKTAWKQFKHGLEHTSYGNTFARYQKDWKPIGHLATSPEFQKQRVQVVGDKKAGGTSDAFLERPRKTLQVMRSLQDVHLLQIMRHPIDASHSLMRSHDGFNTFEQACERIIRTSHAAQQLIESANLPSACVYYETLLTQPVSTLKKLLDWLELPVSSVWLERICQTIDQSKCAASASYDHQEIQITWNMIVRHGAQKEFIPYFPDRCGQTDVDRLSDS